MSGKKAGILGTKNLSSEVSEIGPKDSHLSTVKQFWIKIKQKSRNISNLLTV